MLVGIGTAVLGPCPDALRWYGRRWWRWGYRAVEAGYLDRLGVLRGAWIGYGSGRGCGVDGTEALDVDLLGVILTITRLKH